MKYIKTFESFSPINEEEEAFFGGIGNAIKKKFTQQRDVVVENYLKVIMVLSKKDENEVRKVIDQIRSEKELSKREELLKSLIGDYDDRNIMPELIRTFSIYKGDGPRLSINGLRNELDCMTPEEKEEYENIKGGSTGWEGSRGFH